MKGKSIQRVKEENKLEINWYVRVRREARLKESKGVYKYQKEICGVLNKNLQKGFATDSLL